MPLFLCRWFNGDCSVVWARNKEDAIVELDESAYAAAIFERLTNSLRRVASVSSTIS